MLLFSINQIWLNWQACLLIVHKPFKPFGSCSSRCTLFQKSFKTTTSQRVLSLAMLVLVFMFVCLFSFHKKNWSFEKNLFYSLCRPFVSGYIKIVTIEENVWLLIQTNKLTTIVRTRPSPAKLGFHFVDKCARISDEINICTHHRLVRSST